MESVEVTVIARAGRLKSGQGSATHDAMDGIDMSMLCSSNLTGSAQGVVLRLAISNVGHGCRSWW
eukprot:COSAG01_NODE_5137_length_4461_cov_2.612016_4_plen_65_part_00